MINLIQERATQEQLEEMLEILSSYIKLAVINIRPRQKNRSMEIQHLMIREKVAQSVQQLLGGL